MDHTERQRGAELVTKYAMNALYAVGLVMCIAAIIFAVSNASHGRMVGRALTGFSGGIALIGLGAIIELLRQIADKGSDN